MRHAVAFERDARRWPDDRKRPLTPAGIREFRKVAARLEAVAKRPDRVLASPLVRAWDTALLLHEKAGWPEPQACAALAPGRAPAETLAQLRRLRAKCVALVGHEPDLSQLLAASIAGHDMRVSIEMKKGGAARIVFAGKPQAGRGTLRWLATPRLLLA